MKHNYNLQLFAEMNTNLTSSEGLSKEMKTYYSDYLIDNAIPKLVHDQFEDADSRYVHIVGNGKSDANPSNAHTLDWDGNAWFAGNVICNNVILKSPNGSLFEISVSDDGVLSAT